MHYDIRTEDYTAMVQLRLARGADTNARVNTF